MNTDEAFAEMKRRGWGFIWLGEIICVGPITNPNYVENGEPPLINVLGADKDQGRALEKAIEASTEDK